MTPWPGLAVVAFLGCGREVPVEVPGEGIVLTGVRFTAPTPLGDLVARADEARVDETRGEAAPVTASLASSPPLTVDAQRTSWDLRTGQVDFDGSVSAVRSDLTLTCDHLLVRYSDPSRLESAEASGNVRVVKGAREARSERATLDVASGRLEMSGNPQISEGAQHLAGERIILFLDQERLECEHCRLVVSGEAVRPGARP